jgi:hypothetical protein
MKQDNEYLIYNFHPFSYWIFVIIGILSPIILLICFKVDKTFSILIFVSLIALGSYLSRFGLQPIRIIITEMKIRLEYLSNDLKRIKKINETDIGNIAEFSDYSSTSGQKITFCFKNKMTFELTKHMYFHRMDDFEELIMDLKNRSSQELTSIKTKSFPKYWDYFKTKDARFWYICSIISIPIFFMISFLLNKYLILCFLVYPLVFIIRYKNRK